MKKFFLGICSILLLSQMSCKKSSPDVEVSVKGNYLKIDDDIRELGFIPSPDISVNNFFPYGNSANEIVVYISKKANNIDGLTNDQVVIDIDFNNNLSKLEYDINDVMPMPSVNLNIYITGPNYSGGGRATGGKLYITKDAEGKVNSIKFTNIQITGIHNAVVSCEMKFYE